MSSAPTEAKPAWDSLMDLLTKAGVDNPRDLFETQGQDVGAFLDHFHPPYSMIEAINSALISAVAEHQRHQRESSQAG